MNILTNKVSFNRCLEVVEKALPYRTTIPILNNIHFSIDPEQLTFTATNLEIEIRCRMPYTSSHRGAILLPHKIVEVARSLPTSELEMSINPDSFRIDLTSGQAAFNLYGLDPEEYPAVMEQLPESGFLTLDQPFLKQTLKQVVFAASADEGRPAFNGILFFFDQGWLTLTASDTYRLVVKKIPADGLSFDKRPCLVPARSVRELIKILDDGGSDVTIFPKDKQVIFNFHPVYFSTRVLEEKFPDVSAVIPKQYKTRLRIQRRQFEETVARAALLTEGINQSMNLSVRGSSAEVRVSSQVGRMEEKITAQKEGEDVDLHVNSRFVLEMLRAVDCQDLSIDLNGRNGPIIIRPLEDESYLYLVLPIKME